MRIGELLVEAGLLTPEQVDEVLFAQRRDDEAFGLLCRDMFGLDPTTIETVWVEHERATKACGRPGPDQFEFDALELVTARQAWQFRFVPIRFEGDTLQVLTTEEALPRAVRFATRILRKPCEFVQTDRAYFHDRLAAHFPLGGAELDAA